MQLLRTYYTIYSKRVKKNFIGSLIVNKYVFQENTLKTNYPVNGHR